jgi:hypothetical protein
MLRQRAKFRKLYKLVKRIFQKILRRYSRLGIDDQSRAFTVHSAHENSINLMMQSLGRQYVRYFNGCYERSGTLWEGSYKSCLVQAKDYLLQLYRYIELNPVRANMIEDPADYHWSSYQSNGLGKDTPHPIYMALHSNAIQRQAVYRTLFTSHVEGKLLADIRVNSNKGMAIGNEQFKQAIEALTGRKMEDKKWVAQPTHKKEANCSVGVKLTLTPFLF